MRLCARAGLASRRVGGALQRTGRLESTLIVFTSDNGGVVAMSEAHANKYPEPMWAAYDAGHMINSEQARASMQSLMVAAVFRSSFAGLSAYRKVSKASHC